MHPAIKLTLGHAVNSRRSPAHTFDSPLYTPFSRFSVMTIAGGKLLDWPCKISIKLSTE